MTIEREGDAAMREEREYGKGRFAVGTQFEAERQRLARYVPASDQCECEHAIHVENATDSTAHRYGKADWTRAVRTAYGIFALCRACIECGHLVEVK